MIRILLLVLASLAVVSCGGSVHDPEAELRAWVNTAEARAEDKDRRGLLAMISEGYADGRGNDREQIGNMLRVYFLRQESVAILTSIDEITLMGDTAAQVSVTVGMAGTDASALGMRANAYNFEFELEKPDDDWLLLGARWGQVGRDMR